MKSEIQKILKGTNNEDKRGLFAFNPNQRTDIILKKFRVWSKYFFPDYFIDELGNPVEDAPFHKTMLQGYLMVYAGKEKEFLNVAGKGLSKTTLSKLWKAFCIANDRTHYRKYIKILSKDIDNARQVTTDVYNLLVAVKSLYPEIFRKTEVKREERMDSFTTSTGIKMVADSIGTSQRGDVQESSRPDYVEFDDFEDRLSLASLALTEKIWANMEEARTGLSKDGGCVYNCNYLSERGNVHKLVKSIDHKLITPIAKGKDDNGFIPTWPSYYTSEDIQKIYNKCQKTPDSDFWGEYMCKPSKSMDVYFDRESVDKQKPKEPIDEVSGLKIFYKYNPSHRIGSGHDVGGGVGLDYSTSVFMDFDTIPIQVTATYKNNRIKPDAFGYEIARQCKKFGENFCAVEKNYGSTLDILKTIYPEKMLYKTQSFKPKVSRPFREEKPKEYGWDTNPATKPKMLIDLAQAVESGLIELNDKDLINEMREFTRDDLMDRNIDPRLATRHFDLLMACAIAYQTKNFVPKPEVKRPYDYWMPDNPELTVIDTTGRAKKKSDNPAL